MKCVVYICVWERDRDRERKDIEIKKAVWGKQIYISKNNSAERKHSRRGSVTMSVWGMGLSVPSRTFEKENEINTTSGKAKFLLYLSHQGKVGYLCEPECYEPRSAGWEIPKLASVAPKEALPSALCKPRKLHHQVSWASLNQLLATLWWL